VVEVIGELAVYLLTWAAVLPALTLILVRGSAWRTELGLTVFGGCLTLALVWLLVGEIAESLDYTAFAGRPWRPLIFRGLLAAGLWTLLLWDWRHR
jgi:hypothetical protein